MAACCSRVPAALEERFGARLAQRDLRDYRRKGPGPTTKLLRDGLAAAGGPGEGLLDIGAGIGPLTFELLEGGVQRAVNVEASAAYIAAGREEAALRRRTAQIEWHHGDYVELASGLAPADTVTLDRVVCCYPSFEPLLREAATHARLRIALSYPREVWFVRLVLAVENALRALAGQAFRTFLHPPPEIERLIRGHGFSLSVRRETWSWRADVYSREHGSLRKGSS